jgi:hypothetical protein
MDDKEKYSTFGYQRIRSFVYDHAANRKCSMCDSSSFDLIGSDGVLGVTKHTIHFFGVEPPVYEFWAYIMVCKSCGNQHFMNAKFITNKINELEKDDS